MTGQDRTGTDKGGAEMRMGALPHAPLAMPKQRLERAPSARVGLAVRLLPAWLLAAPMARGTGR